MSYFSKFLGELPKYHLLVEELALVSFDLLHLDKAWILFLQFVLTVLSDPPPGLLGQLPVCHVLFDLLHLDKS
jgi:hypothetical protein